MGERDHAWNRYRNRNRGPGVDDDDDGWQTTWPAAELFDLLHVRLGRVCIFNAVAFVQRTEFTNSHAVVGSRHYLHDDLWNLHPVCVAIRRLVADPVDDLHLGVGVVWLVAESSRASPSQYDGRDDLSTVGLGTRVSACPASALGLLGRYGPGWSDLFRRRVLLDVRPCRALLSFSLACGSDRGRSLPLHVYCVLRRASIVLITTKNTKGANGNNLKLNSNPNSKGSSLPSQGLSTFLFGFFFY